MADDRCCQADERVKERPVWSDLEELPWWAGVLLTAADLLNRPVLSIAVWGFVIARAGLRGLRRSERP